MADIKRFDFSYVVPDLATLGKPKVTVQILEGWPNLEALGEEETLIVKSGNHEYRIKIRGPVHEKTIPVEIDGKRWMLELDLVDGKMRVHGDAELIWSSHPVRSIKLLTKRPEKSGEEPPDSRVRIKRTLQKGVQRVLKWGRG